ncbi:MAG TPA: hypothetical protein VK957_18645 [Lunatimonas sp.]|nr:hypothetical protein [Lunatimonas sp.]
MSTPFSLDYRRADVFPDCRQAHMLGPRSSVSSLRTSVSGLPSPVSGLPTTIITK